MKPRKMESNETNPTDMPIATRVLVLDEDEEGLVGIEDPGIWLHIKFL